MRKQEKSRDFSTHFFISCSAFARIILSVVEVGKKISKSSTLFSYVGCIGTQVLTASFFDASTQVKKKYLRTIVMNYLKQINLSLGTQRISVEPHQRRAVYSRKIMKEHIPSLIPWENVESSVLFLHLLHFVQL